MVPQWDLLTLLAETAEREPTFSLRMNTEVTDVIRADGRITGVRYRDENGQAGEIRAELTVACDGRHSILRRALGLWPDEFPVPFDTWWFRLPRHGDSGEVGGLQARIHGHDFMLQINRNDFFQMAYFPPKGADSRLRAEGVARFRERVATLLPDVADRVDAIETMDQVKTLDVRLNRLREWHRDGVLLIGDAAHAMSPIGGVGINLAVQDALAAARLLAGPLRRQRVLPADLARVRRRRWFPTVVVQGLQRLLHRMVIGPVVTGKRTSYPKPLLTVTRRFPRLRAVPAYLIGIGPLPEHAPDFARRPGGHSLAGLDGVGQGADAPDRNRD